MSPFSRRGFLGAGTAAGLSGLAASGLAGCKSRAYNEESSQKGLFGKGDRAGDSEFDAITIHPSNALAPTRLPAGVKRTVLVVGGGIAGLSAALELAERGYSVRVREAAPYLGGRLHTRQEKLPTGTFRVEHGLHMWFHQYYNFYDILGRDRLNVLDKYFEDFKEVFFLFEDYKPELLKSEGPYPFNLLGIVLNSPNMNLLTAAGAAGALPDLLGFNYSSIYRKYDNITFPDYVRKRMVNKDFYKIIMEPAASVTLNDPQKVSAAEMLVFTNLYFLGHPRAFHRKVTKVDHGTAVIDPWAARIRSLGGEIRVSAPVKGLVVENGRAVGCVGESERYDQVVLACDVPGAQAVLRGSQAKDKQSDEALGTLRDAVDKMRVAPPYRVLRVWFDKPTDPKRPSNQACIETPQFLPIHLVGLFHMLEAESAEWAKRTNGSIVEYHLYNTPDLAGLSEEQVWKRIERLAMKITPELEGAKPLAYSMGSYQNFTSLEVGQASIRPEHDSARAVGLSNVGLAGDWIHTSFPSALMERAVSTGRECANQILVEDNVRKVPLRVARDRGPGLFPKF